MINSDQDFTASESGPNLLPVIDGANNHPFSRIIVNALGHLPEDKMQREQGVRKLIGALKDIVDPFSRLNLFVFLWREAKTRELEIAPLMVNKVEGQGETLFVEILLPAFSEISSHLYEKFNYGTDSRLAEQVLGFLSASAYEIVELAVAEAGFALEKTDNIFEVAQLALDKLKQTGSFKGSKLKGLYHAHAQESLVRYLRFSLASLDTLNYSNFATYTENLYIEILGNVDSLPTFSQVISRLESSLDKPVVMSQSVKALEVWQSERLLNNSVHIAFTLFLKEEFGIEAVTKGLDNNPEIFSAERFNALANKLLTADSIDVNKSARLIARLIEYFMLHGAWFDGNNQYMSAAIEVLKKLPSMEARSVVRRHLVSDRVSWQSGSIVQAMIWIDLESTHEKEGDAELIERIPEILSVYWGRMPKYHSDVENRSNFQEDPLFTAVLLFGDTLQENSRLLFEDAVFDWIGYTDVEMLTEIEVDETGFKGVAGDLIKESMKKDPERTFEKVILNPSIWHKGQKYKEAVRALLRLVSQSKVEDEKANQVNINRFIKYLINSQIENKFLVNVVSVAPNAINPKVSEDTHAGKSPVMQGNLQAGVWEGNNYGMGAVLAEFIYDLVIRGRFPEEGYIGIVDTVRYDILYTQHLAKTLMHKLSLPDFSEQWLISYVESSSAALRFMKQAADHPNAPAAFAKDWKRKDELLTQRQLEPMAIELNRLNPQLKKFKLDLKFILQTEKVDNFPNVSAKVRRLIEEYSGTSEFPAFEAALAKAWQEVARELRVPDEIQALVEHGIRDLPGVILEY